MDIAEIAELAIRTEKWMHDIGAIHDKEGHVRFHITVNQWAEAFDLPLDDDGNATAGTIMIWSHVKFEMIRQGIPIARDGRGHYIGEDGDQISSAVLNVKQALALLNTSVTQLEAIMESGKWLPASEKTPGLLNLENLRHLLEKTPGVVPERYVGVPSERLALLMSGSEN